MNNLCLGCVILRFLVAILRVTNNKVKQYFGPWFSRVIAVKTCKVIWISVWQFQKKRIIVNAPFWISIIQLMVIVFWGSLNKNVIYIFILLLPLKNFSQNANVSERKNSIYIRHGNLHFESLRKFTLWPFAVFHFLITFYPAGTSVLIYAAPQMHPRHFVASIFLDNFDFPLLLIVF